MELDKCISKTESFPAQLRSSIIKDLSKIAELLSSHYTITKNGQTVTSDEVLSFVSKMYSSYNQGTCLAITKSGTRCSTKPNGQSKYCKKHIQQAMYAQRHSQFQSQSQTQSEIQTEIIAYNNDNSKFDSAVPLTKRFINDTVYLVDTHFIYDTKTKVKVGYINQDNNPILTDDPFELGLGIDFAN